MSKTIHAGFKIGKDDAKSISVLDTLIRKTLPFDLPYACKDYACLMR